MGTSTSSSGPKSGISLDPPWLDLLAEAQPSANAPPDDVADAKPSGNDIQENQQSMPNEPSDLAPARRFASARRELGKFARTGNRDNFRKAVGHYSRTGMGGAKNVAKRMRVSTKNAAGLASLLQATREGTDPQISQWVSNLSARNPTAQDVIDDIILQVTSSGGSLDEESCRDSMDQAMSELMVIQPGIDLLKMDDADIWTVVELFLGNEACNRLHQDIGQLFESAMLNPRDAVRRMNEMREYLKSEVSAQVKALREENPNPNSRQMESVLQDALQNTFFVYEGLL